MASVEKKLAGEESFLISQGAVKKDFGSLKISVKRILKPFKEDD
ncbi:MAG: hypothetical protein ACI4NO_01115 [Oxalobacter sp.]